MIKGLERNYSSFNFCDGIAKPHRSNYPDLLVYFFYLLFLADRKQIMLKTNSTHLFRFSFLLLLSYAVALPVSAQSRLETLVGDGGVLLHSPNGGVLVSINPERELVPASLIKIPLAQVALTTLGENFRFETLFYQNSSGDLMIRGLGDPFLVSEEVARITDILAQRGIQQIHRLVMDDSAFEPDPRLPQEQGTDPYAARNSALAVNFNTVNLAWTTIGTLTSAEPQTPLTEIARKLGAQLLSGEPQRINLGDDPLVGLKQAQQLFNHFLVSSGITLTDTDFYREGLTDEWSLFYRHRSSRSLQDNLNGMLRYSNNFIANQLFLTLGAQEKPYPTSVDMARAMLQQQLSELYGDNFGIDPQLLLMIEGSGLLREQRTTATGMMHVLKVFEPYADLLPEVNGVLRKSGTLTGVYNFAGYIAGSDGLYPFVILTNQESNNRAEILQSLEHLVD